MLFSGLIISFTRQDFINFNTDDATYKPVNVLTFSATLTTCGLLWMSTGTTGERGMWITGQDRAS